MSWQDDVMAEQEAADALEYMGEAEWRDMYKDDITYRYANPEVTKAFNILDRKEKMTKTRSEYNKEYWAKHREEISAHRKVYYQEHKKEIDDRNKQWFKDNKDKWNAYLREYRKRKKLDKEAQV